MQSVNYAKAKGCAPQSLVTPQRLEGIQISPLLEPPALSQEPFVRLVCVCGSGDWKEGIPKHTSHLVVF